MFKCRFNYPYTQLMFECLTLFDPFLEGTLQNWWLYDRVVLLADGD